MAGDLFCHEGLQRSGLVLVDIDRQARADLEAYLKKLNDTWGQSWTIRGGVPTGLHGWMQTIVDEQELTVEAALTGSREVLHQAMTVSPMVQNKDCIEELSEKLLEANRDYLGQFSFD